MNEYKLESGHEMPLTQGNIYPFKEMEVGDSFTFPLEKRHSIQSIASRQKAEGKVFRVKKISDEECRIWRIK